MKTSDYVLGYNRTLMQVYANRRAEHQGKFVLPYLKAGMNVLDIGCGPGTIATDIARLVYPGKVVGIDMNNEQLITARAYAKNQFVHNVDFKCEDACQLSFPNATFHLIFMHGLLCTVPDPLAILREAKRVCKEHGIIASREPYCKSYIFYPENEFFKRGLELAHRANRLMGRDLNIGSKLKSLFMDFQLVDIQCTASCDWQSDEKQVRQVCDALISDWQDSPWSETVRKEKWVTNEWISELLVQLKNFSQDPTTFLCIPWMEAVGVVSHKQNATS